MLSHHFMNVIWVMKYVWHGWNTPQTTTWPQTTPQTRSDVPLDIIPKSLNNDHHQWYSGLRMMTQVWICYPTISWMLYESWSTSDRGGSPHRPPHDHKLHTRNAQLLPWILYPRAWTMILISGVVVQWWWLRNESPNRPRHDLQLHPRHAQLLPWILEPRAWIMVLISGVVPQWRWCRYGYGITPF